MNLNVLGMDPTQVICLAGLLYGAIEDLRTKKIKNTTNLAILAVGIIVALSPLSKTGWTDIFISVVYAFALMLPLFFLKVLGGGDVKLFVAVSPLITSSGILYCWVASLIWGSLFGIILIVLNGRLSTFATNMKLIYLKVKPPETSLQKIPFSIALLFGYLTFLLGSGVLK